MEQQIPIEWPQVTIDGVTFKLKYDLGVTYLASKAGIDLKLFGDSARQLSVVLDMFALMVGPQLEELHKPVLTGQEWAVKIGTLPVLAEISTALGRALQLSKVVPTEKAPTPNVTADTEPRPN